ncbi:hypothetical protein HT031_000498 [Scenedesmus sp. PABB004]|nr:hypothetical protein HT031_000498 [Scenedesmus sp. PABB004]
MAAAAPLLLRAARRGWGASALLGGAVANPSPLAEYKLVPGAWPGAWAGGWARSISSSAGGAWPGAWPGAWARGISSSAGGAAPQLGGYMGTGHAADDHPAPRFFVTGACGQIGQEYLPFLRAKVGVDNVIASDVRSSRRLLDQGPFSYCDVLDKDNMTRIVLENGCTHIVHLATLLSAVGERNPSLALKVNTHGIQNVLELAATHDLAVYAPSTIAVFGPSTPRTNTPDVTVARPTTIYGVSKVHQELLGDYYHARYGVDYRSLRYPGIISADSAPGGGTTDYAVEVFTAALTAGHYTCFIGADVALPMMYMPDCLDATWRLMTAPRDALQQRTFNVTAASFTPAELGEAIRRRLPRFTISYKPDFRDDIARTWPSSIDDSAARAQWGWAPKYDLQGLADDMLRRLAPRYGVALPPELAAGAAPAGAL